MRILRSILCISALLCLVWSMAASANACDNDMLSTGQTIYVPAYSHIYSANNEKPFLLTVTLSIRNTDMHNPIRVSRVDYYATQGHLLTKYLKEDVVLGPLESLRYVVPERDESGGSGANFIVNWAADKCTNPPIVESIMIGTQLQQGISFTSRGQVLVDTEK